MCPFLREAKVRSCRRAAMRKLIPAALDTIAEERCATPAFADCPVYQQNDEGDSECQPSCPLLSEQLMQYCSASSITHFVPYSEAVLTRCGTSAHRYCDLYLGMNPSEPDQESQDNIVIPERLRYSRNHWWIDESEDGLCHIGIDGFLARLLGSVDRVDFATQPGITRPIAILTTQGTEWQMVFPERVRVKSCNVRLKSKPAKLTAGPYSVGWLFEAEQKPGLADSFMDARAAQEWMDQDVRQLNQRLQDANPGYAADGGMFVQGLLSMLDRNEALGIFNDFCAPRATQGGNY